MQVMNHEAKSRLCHAVNVRIIQAGELTTWSGRRTRQVCTATPTEQGITVTYHASVEEEVHGYALERLGFRSVVIGDVSEVEGALTYVQAWEKDGVRLQVTVTEDDQARADDTAYLATRPEHRF